MKKKMEIAVAISTIWILYLFSIFQFFTDSELSSTTAVFKFDCWRNKKRETRERDWSFWRLVYVCDFVGGASPASSV